MSLALIVKIDREIRIAYEAAHRTGRRTKTSQDGQTRLSDNGRQRRTEKN
jgi:hypothetical protein